MLTSVTKKLARLAVALPLVALLAGPAYAARTSPIYSPEPIPVPAGKSIEDVKKAVRKALFDKDWEARDIAPGHIQGKHTKTDKKSSYTAVVDVKFDTKTVRISYKDSENLNYDAKDQTIHKTYNGWAKNLEREIRGALGAY
jgi:hypothetical protein